MKTYWPALVIILAAFASTAIVAVVAPTNLPVVAYKAQLVCIGIFLGYAGNEFFVKIENEIAQSILILGAIHGMTAGL